MATINSNNNVDWVHENPWDYNLNGRVNCSRKSHQWPLRSRIVSVHYGAMLSVSLFTLCYSYVLNCSHFHPPTLCEVSYAVINKNRSCSVSLGLSQLAFWVWKLLHCWTSLTCVFAKINNRRTCVKGDVGKRKAIFSIRPSSGSCSGVKILASAEYVFMSVLCNPYMVTV